MGRNPAISPQFLIHITSIKSNVMGEDEIEFDLFGPYMTAGEAVLEREVLKANVFKAPTDSLEIFSTGKPLKKYLSDVTQITPAFLDETIRAHLPHEHISAIRKLHNGEIKKRKRKSEDNHGIVSTDETEHACSTEETSKPKKVEKTPREPTAYNIFIKEQMALKKAQQAEAKANNPDHVIVDHKEMFKIVAASWAVNPLNPKHLENQFVLDTVETLVGQGIDREEAVVQAKAEWRKKKSVCDGNIDDTTDEEPPSKRARVE